MPDRHTVTLLSGGHKGAEAEFGRCAQRWGIPELTYSFEGHQMEWRAGEVHMLSPEDLAKGDVSMEIVSQHMGRGYTNLEAVRRVIQSMYHVVVGAYQVFAVGWIQPDGTVMGGTGWGVELAKFFNRPVSVYDQDRKAWFLWQAGAWVADDPTIGGRPFAGTGTRRLTLAGSGAIQTLFEKSFGPAPERRATRGSALPRPSVTLDATIRELPGRPAATSRKTGGKRRAAGSANAKPDGAASPARRRRDK